MIRKTIGSIVIYGAVMHAIIMVWYRFDFTPYIIYPAQSLNTLNIFFLVWWVLRLLYVVMRKILKVLSLPIGFITFGVSNTFINIGILYLFPVVLSAVQSEITITIGSFLEIVMLSVLLAVLWIVTKYF